MTATISNLPTELLTMILELAAGPYDDEHHEGRFPRLVFLSDASLVSKSWRDPAQALLFRHPQLDIPGMVTLFCQSSLHNRYHTRSLHLGGMFLPEKVMKEVAGFLDQYGTWLRALRLDEMRSLTFSGLALDMMFKGSSLNGLTSLSLHCECLTLDEEQRVAIGANLEELDLGYPFILGGVAILNDIVVAQQAGGKSSLTRLDLEHLFSLSGEGYERPLEPIFTAFLPISHQLTRIFLPPTDEDPPDGQLNKPLYPFLHSATSLLHLSISFDADSLPSSMRYHLQTILGGLTKPLQSLKLRFRYLQDIFVKILIEVVSEFSEAPILSELQTLSTPEVRLSHLVKMTGGEKLIEVLRGKGCEIGCKAEMKEEVIDVEAVLHIASP